MDKNDLEEIFANSRQHAPYFHFRGDKAVTEYGVATDWIDAKYGPQCSLFLKARALPQGEDPPDVCLTTTDGTEWAVEVTELVNRCSVEAAERNESYEEVIYDAQRLESEIRSIVSKKDLRCFESKYSRRILLIFCDEPFVFVDEALAKLPAVDLGQLRNLDEVYLMLPPVPSVEPGGPENPYCVVLQINST